MGGRRHKERSVNTDLAKRLRGFKGLARKYLSGGSAGRGMRQRGRRQGALQPAQTRQVAGKFGAPCLGPGAGQRGADGKHGVFYDAAREGVDAKQEAVQWAQKRHHFRLIAHAHILFRGKDDQGQDLILCREYIGYGIRQRASEAATDLLGLRTQREVEQVREKEVQAEQFTSLDRTIERHMDEKHVIDVSPDERIGWRRLDRHW